MIVDPQAIAEPYLQGVRDDLRGLPPVKLVGLLGTNDRGAQVYADYTAKGCAAVGIGFDLRRLEPEQVSEQIFQANLDPSIHGVIVYYPVFGGARDRSLQNEVAPEKDVEGLHASWAGRLYHDIRHVDADGKKKALLPCTPLGIVKAFESLGTFDVSRGPHHQAEGLVATVFNRSEVVGRPLAAMLAHDGAKVWSFDIDGCVLYEGQRTTPTDVDRATALAQSDIVVTGVPARDFPQVRAAELKAGATCVNFSHVCNLHDDVATRARHVLLRVGPITVAMLLRNTLRLYRNFHRQAGAQG